MFSIRLSIIDVCIEEVVSTVNIVEVYTMILHISFWDQVKVHFVDKILLSSYFDNKYKYLD